MLLAVRGDREDGLALADEDLVRARESAPPIAIVSALVALALVVFRRPGRASLEQ